MTGSAVPLTPESARRILETADLVCSAAAVSEAVRSGDRARIINVLGPESAAMLNPDEVQGATERRSFLQAYDSVRVLVPAGPEAYILEVGAGRWPLPLPIIKAGANWKFDTNTGIREMVLRRSTREPAGSLDYPIHARQLDRLLGVVLHDHAALTIGLDAGGGSHRPGAEAEVIDGELHDGDLESGTRLGVGPLSASRADPTREESPASIGTSRSVLRLPVST